MPPRRQSAAAAARAAAPAGADEARHAPPAPAAHAHASPKKQVKLHRFAQPHKYDVHGCPIYTPAEVVADTLVHVVGLPFGFGASYIMLEEVHARLPQPWSADDKRRICGLWVYAFGLLAMLCGSAMYNIVGCGMKRHTALLRRIDHACIYTMIAGCYTPCLLHLEPGVISAYLSNELALAGIWVIALAGAAAKFFLARKFETRGLVLYVVLGTCVLAFTHAVKIGYPGGAALLWEFEKSGACYLLGLVFYLDDTHPFSNALWHSCVLAGAVSHWVIMYRLVAAGDARYPLA